MKSLRMYLLLLLLLGGIGAYADDVEFDVASDGWNVSYSGTANVTLKGRTFTKGEWSGFCLPFDASKETLDAAFGEGCYSLQQAYSSFADNKIQFRKVAKAVGGTPYFIYVNKTVENPKFDNVTFVSDIGLTWGGNQSDWRGAITINDNLTFRGFFFKKYNYELYNATSDQTINAYYLTGDGILQDVRKREYTDSPLGIDVCILITGYSSSFQKPTVVFEEDDVINSGGTSGGGFGESGGESGSTDDPTSLSYKIKNKLQLTDVPTLYLTIPDVTDLDKDLVKNRQTGEALYHKASIDVVDKNNTLEEFSDDKLDIKVRGNSTADPSKRAYRLKFGKDEKDKVTGKLIKTHKHDLMGGGYAKRNWALLANCFDHSLIRNALTCELGKIIGMPFNPGYCFVDLVINGDYRGTYQVTDHPEVGSHRIDIDEDKDWYIEFQGRSDMLDEPYLNIQDLPMFSIKNPDYTDAADADKLAALKVKMEDWVKQWKSGFSYDASITQSDTKGWRAYNDEDQLLKWFLETEITADYDGYMTIKAYRATDGKLFWGPVWDKDLAWDNYGDYTKTLGAALENASSIRYYVYNPGSGTAILSDPRFVKRVYETYNKLVEDGLEQKLLDIVDQLHLRVNRTQQLNFEKWGITTVYGGLEKYHEWTDYAQYPEQLKTFIIARLAFLKEKFKKIYDDVCTVKEATYTPTNQWYSTDLTTGSYLNQKVVGRSFKANQWNTYCMPFSTTMEQMKEVFGNDVQVVAHSGMDIDGTTMLFAPYTSELKAGCPYLVMPSADVSDPTFKDVINTDTPVQKESYNGQSVSFDGKHSFYGTLFTADVVDKSTDYLFSKDVYSSASSLAQATSNTENGARAFIRVSDGTTPAIKIQTADEASKFTYDVTNGYVHTAWCQYDNQTKNVTIENRGTLHAGEWNMMCLPFKLSAAGYKKAFGEDVKVAEFTGVTKSEGGELVSFNLAYINEKNGMKAATPYLIKPSKEIPMADVTFEGVKVSAKTTEEQATGDVNCKLIGTLQPTILDKGHQQLVLKARNELQYMAPNSTTPMQACRAYFELTGTVAAAKNFSFSIDGETTGVKVIDVNAPSASTNTRVYNMNGQLVGTSVENLPQGIYVIAGKKVVK
ncbi:MAG: hypothetical protein EGS41_08340 [Prevotella sp.]|nr:hypothetical protein [Prevotella sp.]